MEVEAEVDSTEQQAQVVLPEQVVREEQAEEEGAPLDHLMEMRVQVVQGVAVGAQVLMALVV
jgi:hypothetical protein